MVRLMVSSEEGYNIDSEGDLIYNEQLIGNGIGMYIVRCSFKRDFSEPFYVVYIVDIDNHDISEEESPNAYTLAFHISKCSISFLTDSRCSMSLKSSMRGMMGSPVSPAKSMIVTEQTP